jgi:hypothetical protein
LQPAAAQHEVTVRNHEAAPAERRRAQEQLKEQGVSEDQLEAVRKEFEPHEPEGHDPCDTATSPDAVERCKKLRDAGTWDAPRGQRREPIDLRH